MTVRQFAESRCVTRQAVYQLAEKAGRKLSEFTDKKGNLSEEGVAFLESLLPDKVDKPEEPVSGSEPEPTKESEVDRLRNENRILLESVNNLTATINGLREDLSQAQKIADQAQQLHAADKKLISKLKLRLEAGSNSPEDPIQPDQPEGESQEEKTEPETIQTEEPEQDPEKTEDPKPAAEPEQKSEDQPDGVGESSSPVTGSEQTRTELKPEEQKKLSLRQRLRILFTGKEPS